jgi:hypothetical protein
MPSSPLPTLPILMKDTVILFISTYKLRVAPAAMVFSLER